MKSITGERKRSPPPISGITTLRLKRGKEGLEVNLFQDHCQLSMTSRESQSHKKDTTVPSPLNGKKDSPR
ncbi:MAG: hypothetical protein KFF72_16770 [Arthrospira sp. SH-MAG29]|nr:MULTISPECIES: hypothetical protein [unclassified Arthrospira]MBS0017974.1 hypothetical protein [Arthrospira sp. SH-MAG29]